MFKINDFVICINDKPDPAWEGFQYLREGKTYQVADKSVCNCSTRLLLKGFPHKASLICGGCYYAGPIRGFLSSRFIKLAGDDINTEEKEEAPCSDSINQKTVQKTGFMDALKRLKEKISA